VYPRICLRLREKSKAKALTQRTEWKNREKVEKAELWSARFSRFDSPALGCGWFLGLWIFRFSPLSKEKRQQSRRERRIEIMLNYNSAAIHPQRASSV
jgi:hypothetical protein